MSQSLAGPARKWTPAAARSCARNARVREKGHPTGIVAPLTDGSALESRNDLLFAAQAVGAQFGAHKGNDRHYSVEVAHACRGRGSPQKH
jgi:hypothetical protein